MASLSAFVTAPHRLDDLAKEFGFPRHEVIIAVSTIAKTILFFREKLIVLSGGSFLTGYEICTLVDRGSLAYADVAPVSDGFNIKFEAKNIDLSFYMTDGIAAKKLRAWLIGE